MDPNRLTQKCQEAVHDAQSRAVRAGHQEVDVEHLLAALLDQSEGLLPRLLRKMDIPTDAVRERLEQELAKRPQVSGPGAAPGNIYVTQTLNRVLVAAEDEAKRLKDEYVSVEHVVLAILSAASGTPAARALTEAGVTRAAFLKALSEVPGPQRVQSASPEATYEALERYGRDLVKEARTGRLDPVIGRDAEIR
ncbi:MAG: Clp protease N-terminal domain-containing protein, partial [Phycisphaerae bacterium]